ncbi:KilA-N domain-containing protein [Ferrimonas balearica]|uniref:KilA-N domain-containing protein n=1 Tax=Ferrimonas balearica TaxID=44012 RepID=UPI001C94BF41|nr:KilA-N domain-containing protein [Ferrimonas balearica]MBY6104973.1 KilA-N domain-containing protein [Ferrimonas balearica]
MANRVFVFDGVVIREDEGFLCLNDLAIAIGAPAKRLPGSWLAAANYARKEMGLARIQDGDLVRVGTGPQGTWAAPSMMIEYASWNAPWVGKMVAKAWAEYRPAKSPSGDAHLQQELPVQELALEKVCKKPKADKPEPKEADMADKLIALGRTVEELRKTDPEAASEYLQFKLAQLASGRPA